MQNAWVFLFATLFTGSTFGFAAIPKFAHPSELQFNGNKEFSDEAIRAGLSRRSPFLKASHPIVGSPEKIARVIESGYRHAGFIKARVKHSGEGSFAITEGNQFMAGQIRFERLKPGQVKQLQAQLDELLLSAEKGPLWQAGKPAQLSIRNLELICDLVEAQANVLRITGGRFGVIPEPDEESGICHLKLKWNRVAKDEGIIVESVELHGLKRHTNEQVLDYMGFKPGMTAAEWEQLPGLRNSGRFAEVLSKWLPGKKPGNRVFHATLIEYDRSPPLGKPLPAWRRTAMDLLWPFGGAKGNRPDEFVFTLNIRGGEGAQEWMKTFKLQSSSLTIARHGVRDCMAWRGTDLNGTKKLLGATVNQFDGPIGFMVGVGVNERWVLPLGKTRPVKGGMLVNLFIRSKAERDSRGNMFSINTGLGLSSDSSRPVTLNLEVSPVTLIEKILQDQPVGVVYDKVEKVVTTGRDGRKIETITIPGMVFKRHLAEDTGQLLGVSFQGKLDGVPVEAGWKYEVGATKQMAAQILAETKMFKNRYDPEQPLTSAIDLFGGNLIKVAKAFELFQEEDGKMIRAIRDVISPFGKIGGAQTMAEFEPQSLPDAEAKEQLTKGVHASDGTIDQAPDGLPVLVSPIICGWPELFFKSDSYAATLARQILLMQIGHSDGAAELCTKLGSEVDMGPFGHLFAARILNHLDHPAGVMTAQAGVKTLNMEGLAKDIRQLADDRSPLVQSLQKWAHHPIVFTETAWSGVMTIGGLPLTQMNLNPVQFNDFMKQNFELFKKDPATGFSGMIVNQHRNYTQRLAINMRLETFGPLSRLQVSAKKGEVPALFFLGLCYSFGLKGLAPNSVNAYYWLSKAALKGHREADQLRQQLRGKMTFEQLKEANLRLLKRD